MFKVFISKIDKKCLKYQDYVCTYKKVQLKNICNKKYRIETIYANLLLRYALKSVGFENLTEKIFVTENGRPKIAGDKLYFDISHSGDYAVVCVSDKNIAVDIEKISKSKLKDGKRESLIDRVLTKREKEQIINKSRKKQMQSFFEIWTKKESYMKFCGEGLKKGFLNIQTEKNKCEDLVCGEIFDIYTFCLKDIKKKRNCFVKKMLESLSNKDYAISVCMENEKKEFLTKMSKSVKKKQKDSVFDIIIDHIEILKINNILKSILPKYLSHCNELD